MNSIYLLLLSAYKLNLVVWVVDSVAWCIMKGVIVYVEIGEISKRSIHLNVEEPRLTDT